MPLTAEYQFESSLEQSLLKVILQCQILAFVTFRGAFNKRVAWLKWEPEIPVNEWSWPLLEISSHKNFHWLATPNIKTHLLNSSYLFHILRFHRYKEYWVLLKQINKALIFTSQIFLVPKPVDQY